MSRVHSILSSISTVLTAFAIGLAMVAAPAAAENVYRWTTEDGTVAFTDDENRVPARYRETAVIQSLESLSGYGRLTQIQAADLQTPTPPAIAKTASASKPILVSGLPMSVMTGSTRYGSGGISLPVGGPLSDDSEPVLIEQRRVKLDSSMATAHETVIRQGDRILSIQRNESSQRDDTGMVPPLGY